MTMIEAGDRQIEITHEDRLTDHRTHILEHGEDMGDLGDWHAGAKELRP